MQRLPKFILSSYLSLCLLSILDLVCAQNTTHPAAKESSNGLTTREILGVIYLSFGMLGAIAANMTDRTSRPSVSSRLWLAVGGFVAWPIVLPWLCWLCYIKKEEQGQGQRVSQKQAKKRVRDFLAANPGVYDIAPNLYTYFRDPNPHPRPRTEEEMQTIREELSHLQTLYPSITPEGV